MTHLLFADDSLVMIKADVHSATEICRILDVYERCSGQMINKEKSSILFSKNIERGQRQRVMNALHLSTEAWTKSILVCQYT